MRILFIAAALVLVTNASAQHRVGLDPLTGSISYSYPISTRTVNGATVNVGLTYAANVAQISFTGAYSPGYENPTTFQWVPAAWPRSTRLHGAWLMSVNGFVVQSFSSLPIEPAAWASNSGTNSWEDVGRQWFTKGYDVCSRLDIIDTDGEQDAIEILLADGSVLDLRNETSWDDDPVQEADLYSGRYYHNALNSSGFGIVEIDTTTYWPSELKALFADENGNVPVYMLPRVLRYYLGDGLEYVFREIVAPYGDPRVSHADGFDAGGKQAVGVRIFYLEEVNKEHARIATIERSKHRPSAGKVDNLPGRALFTGTTGLHVDYGDDQVTIQSEGKTHRLVLRTQDRYDTLGSESSYQSHTISQADRIFPSLGYNHRHPDDLDLLVTMALTTTTSSSVASQRLSVREIIAPDGERTVFDYAPRNGKHGNVQFTSLLLSRVRDRQGRTDIGYHTALGHSYTSEEVAWLLGQTRESFHNVCSTLVTSSAGVGTNAVMYESTIDVVDGLGVGPTPGTWVWSSGVGTGPDTLNGNVVQVPFRYTHITHRDHSYDNPNNVITERYRWARFAIQPFFATDRDVSNSTTDDLYHFFPLIYRRTTWESQLEIEGRDTLVDAGSRMTILPVSRQTRYRERATEPLTHLSTQTYSYSFAPGDGVFVKNDVDNLHRRFLASTSVTSLRSQPSPAAPLPHHTRTTSYLNLGYATPGSCWVKDTLVDEDRTRRMIDSARGIGSIQHQRALITPSAASARTVTLAPLLGLIDQELLTDPAGTILSGVDHAWHSNYECTGNGQVPTFPLGGHHTTDVIGSAAAGVPVSGAPKIRTSETAYSNSHWRMQPRQFRSAMGVTTRLATEPHGLQWSILRNDGSTPTIFLNDDDFLGSGITRVSNEIRTWYPNHPSGKYDNVQTITGSYDGSKGFMGSTSAPTVAMRSDDVTTSATVWADGDFSTGWKPRHPWVKLWSAASEITNTPGGVSEDRRRLMLMQPWTLPPAATGNTTDIVRSSAVTLKYHAHTDDILHTQTGSDHVTLRMTVVDIWSDNETLPTPIRFDVTFSQGGLATPVVQTYEIVQQAHAMRGPDSSALGVIEIEIDAPVVQAMRAMSNGQVMDIDITLDATLMSQWVCPIFCEFAAHGEDVAPRLVVDTDSLHQDIPDETITDNTARSQRTILSSTLARARTSSKLDATRRTTVDAESDGVAKEERAHVYAADPVAVPNSAVTYQAQRSAAGGVVRTHLPNGLMATSSHSFAQEDSSYLEINVGQGPLIMRSPARRSRRGSFTPNPLPRAYGAVRMFTEMEEDTTKRTITVVNTIGQRLETRQGSAGDTVITRFIYNPVTDRLDTVVVPDGQRIVYHYDAFGRVARLDHPDLGTTRYAYDERSLLRFVQTSEQAIPVTGRTRVTFFEYDDLGRVTLTGEACLAPGVDITILNPSVINAGALTDTTRNHTVLIPPIRSVPQLSRQRLLGACIPAWGNRRPPYEHVDPQIDEVLVRPAVTPTYLGPVAQYPGAAGANDFERVNTYPEFPRQAVLYDKLPDGAMPTGYPGAIWAGLPPRQTLGCLAPTGSLRNQFGKVAAVAYRDHAGQPYWYKVYSYDHRGRVECEIRLDDALGMSITYYTYDAGGNLTCLRTVDALRNHATWYDYDRLGRVTELRTALSAAGPLFGLGLNVNGAPNMHRCYTAMLPTFVQRPAEPDVTYAYDVLGRATSVVHAAAVPTGATSTERTFHWRLPMTVQRTETVSTPPAVVAAHHRTFGVDLRVADRADTVGAVQRVGTVEYDDKGRVKDVASAPGDPLAYQHDVLSRRERTDVQSTPAAARDYTYVTAGTELVRVDNTPNTAETLDLLWDSQGRVRRRIMSGPPATVTEDLSYGYHDRLLQVVVDDQGRTGGCPTSEQTDSSNHSDHETWAYRYGPGGLREQKRLVTDQLDDRTECGVAPWTHYVRSPGGDPLVVYHGRQTSENPCSVTGLGLYDRRVHIYAHEYRVYGPDGLRVLFERNAQGVFIKRAVTLDAQGSIATVTDAAGYQHAEIHDDHGERSTVPQRRTGWLDRELDYETAPGHVPHKLYDLDHRKYDAATAQFLSVDPLWSMFISSGSYVYCTGDAINNVDPWGLGEEETSPLIPPPSKPKVPCSPMVIGHGDETIGGSLWTYEILFGQYLRKLGATGDGMGPYGSGPGQSWVASPRGIGPGGKGGVGYWSGRGATSQAPTYNASQLSRGAQNLGFGLLGVFTSGVVIVGTEGMAAPIAWMTFTASLSTTMIGFTQVVDAFANPSMPTSPLRNADNLPGLIAYGVDSPYSWSINSGVNLGTAALGGAPVAQVRTLSYSTNMFQRSRAIIELYDFGRSADDYARSLGLYDRKTPVSPAAVRVGPGLYMSAYP
jgi:RHS repeat-associated protein